MISIHRWSKDFWVGTIVPSGDSERDKITLEIFPKGSEKYNIHRRYRGRLTTEYGWQIKDPLPVNWGIPTLELLDKFVEDIKTEKWKPEKKEEEEEEEEEEFGICAFPIAQDGRTYVVAENRTTRMIVDHNGSWRAGSVRETNSQILSRTLFSDAPETEEYKALYRAARCERDKQQQQQQQQQKEKTMTEATKTQKAQEIVQENNAAVVEGLKDVVVHLSADEVGEMLLGIAASIGVQVPNEATGEIAKVGMAYAFPFICLMLGIDVDHNVTKKIVRLQTQGAGEKVIAPHRAVLSAQVQALIAKVRGV